MIIEQVVVETGIPLLHLFPFQIWIGQPRRFRRRLGRSRSPYRVIVRIDIRRIIIVTYRRLVTHDPPTATNFQKSKARDLREPAFIGNIPSERSRREITIPVIYPELRAAIPPQCRRQQISSAIVIVQTADIGQQVPLLLTPAKLQIADTRIEILQIRVVSRLSLVLSPNIIISKSFCGYTRQQGEMMIVVYRQIIGSGIIPCPVRRLVLLLIDMGNRIIEIGRDIIDRRELFVVRKLKI